MSELTLKAIEQLLDTKLDEKLALLATKADVDDAVEQLAQIISSTVVEPFTERFNELEQKLDMTAKLQSFERKFQKLEEALHIKL